MSGQTIGSGTAAGLVEFLDVVVKKGRATAGAITPIRTAFIKVVEAVDDSEWRQVQVDTIDVDEYMQRFAILTKGTYTPKSVSVYKSHISRAIGWYRRFMSTEEAGWMPIIAPRSPRPRSDKQEARLDSSGVKTSPPSKIDLPTHTAPSAGLITYPFPLRDGQIVHLSLPARMHKSDAERIAQFVRTLVIDTHEKAEDNENEKAQR